MNWPDDFMNKIICGDCLEVMKEMPGKCVDLVLTDPPYGIGIASNPFRQKHARADWDNTSATKEQINEIFRVGKEQIIWGGNYFNLPPTQCFYIWDKQQPEDFSSAMCEMAWVSKSSPAKMFRKWVVSYKKFHPTEKPLDLMCWCLSMFPEARVIFDPFLGSGTTAEACKLLKRDFIGMEINPNYCKIAEERLAQGVL